MLPEWDVEDVRSEHESEEQWQLRRSFMLEHKQRFPKDELVCLAQLFTNIQFLGCRYPDETMRKVAELSKQVTEQHEASRKNKLKRTFVRASDAAEAKAKRSFAK